MVKSLFIHTGMLSDECSRVPEDKLMDFEKDWGEPPEVMTCFYRMHASDFDNQHNDDQLYPGKVSNDILK